MDNIYDIALSMPRFKKIEVSSVLFTEYKCLDDRSIFAAWAHINYFIYVFSGKMEWHTTENNYLLRSNDVIFVKRGANIIHKSFEEDFCALIIFIPDEFIRDLIVQAPIQLKKGMEIVTESVIPVNSDNLLDAYFSSLFAYFFSESQPLPHIMEIKFKELIYNLLVSHKNVGIISYFKEVAQNKSSSIKSIMEANFTYNLSLNEFARLAHRSLSVFKRDFFTTYHTSPGRWLTDKRLQYAKKLLEKTDKKAFEVAFESGFENPSHFTRAFKSKYGITPLNYKKTSDTPLATLDF